ncbi:MAG: GTPase family protein [Hyphomicrobiaceae bacterium]
MKPERKSLTYLRMSLVALGMALPMITLVPFGSVWLWQQGYLLPWALAACASTFLAFLLQLWLFRRLPQSTLGAPPAERAVADSSWTPQERAAWEAVETLAGTVTPDRIASRDAAIALALRTVETVARRIHPEVKDPLWEFTVPEALALIERVSNKLRLFVDDNVPLGDRLTVAHMLRLYRWRGVVEVAEKAHGIWRLVRLLNPVTAVTHEMREQMSNRLYAWGKEHVAKRLAQGYVEEVGRAAIDLYGGRLAVAHEQMAAHVSEASEHDRQAARMRVAEPLRILVAGQTSAGKSSLVNALAQEVKTAVDALPATEDFTPYELSREGFPAALTIDSPGLDSDRSRRDALVERAAHADLILWVCAAHRPDRENDRLALNAIREYFAAKPDRRPPPIVLVLTNIDRLPPPQEWNPPYDPAKAEDGKAAAIKDAVAAVGADLGFAAGDVVPVSLRRGTVYNVDTLWAKMLLLVPEAIGAQLVRNLRDLESRWQLKKLWSQAKNAGRILTRGLTKR